MIPNLKAQLNRSLFSASFPAMRVVVLLNLQLGFISLINKNVVFRVFKLFAMTTQIRLYARICCAVCPVSSEI